MPVDSTLARLAHRSPPATVVCDLSGQLHVDLIEEWIAVGAPETGFATALGCH